MNGYRAILEKEIIEAWRTYRIAIACGLFTALGIAVPLLLRYLPRITGLFGQVDPELRIDKTGVPDVVEALVQMLWLAGSLAGVLLAMGSVSVERATRTAAFVLTKPVNRAAFLWAKFVAVAMILGLATALAVLATWLYAALLFEPQDAFAWAQLWLLAWLSSLAWVAVTFAASCMVRSAAGAAAIGVAAFIAVSLAATVVTLDPWLPSGLGGVAQALVLGELGPDLDPARTVVATIAVIGAALGLSWARFARTDL
jgi:ABC-2 type transport system permease protein